MTLDAHNEPQPGEAERPEAQVIRVWPHGPRWPNTYHVDKPLIEGFFADSPALAITRAREMFPGHTIDLSAEPPEGISR